MGILKLVHQRTIKNLFGSCGPTDFVLNLPFDLN